MYCTEQIGVINPNVLTCGCYHVLYAALEYCEFAKTAYTPRSLSEPANLTDLEVIMFHEEGAVPPRRPKTSEIPLPANILARCGT